MRLPSRNARGRLMTGAVLATAIAIAAIGSTSGAGAPTAGGTPHGVESTTPAGSGPTSGASPTAGTPSSTAPTGPGELTRSGGPGGASPTNLTGAVPGKASSTPPSEIDHGAATAVPAPPAPPLIRPSERVVAGGLPAGTAGRTRSRSASFTPASLAAVQGPKPTPSGTAAPGGGTARTLVLYDNTGPYGWLGEVYGMQTANLVSHFGSWVAHPVGSYTAGELSTYTAVVYVGSTYDEPVPVAFLDDAYATTIPVVWLYDNIWQLTARQPTFATDRGYTWKQFDVSSVAQVRYKGTSLTRDTQNLSGIMDTVVYDPTKVTVLADAVRPDATTFPWALRSGNLTYIGEIPFAYVSGDDRYLAFSDLLFDALAPAAATRHRALVRIEDVGPDADPAELRAVTNYLYSKNIPFSVAVYPRYVDPLGVYNAGKPEDYTLAQRPRVVTELKFMQTHGGTLLMHGYTHQYGKVANPYDGVSANDFEFYRAHVDTADNVIYDGPVAEDTAAWATNRITAAGSAFKAAGLATPTIFEFPHYAGSAVDYATVNSKFTTRYCRGLYFPGTFSGSAPDYTRLSGQFFPYTVRDVYGTAVVPENIGNIEPEPFNNHPARLPADLIASAKNNLAIRDSTASFFYHPYLGTAYLQQTVDGIQALGYSFVSASAMLA